MIAVHAQGSRGISSSSSSSRRSGSFLEACMAALSSVVQCASGKGGSRISSIASRAASSGPSNPGEEFGEGGSVCRVGLVRVEVKVSESLDDRPAPLLELLAEQRRRLQPGSVLLMTTLGSGMKCKALRYEDLGIAYCSK